MRIVGTTPEGGTLLELSREEIQSLCDAFSVLGIRPAPAPGPEVASTEDSPMRDRHEMSWDRKNEQGGQVSCTCGWHGPNAEWQEQAELYHRVHTAMIDGEN